jgi:hypothetical protein
MNYREAERQGDGTVRIHHQGHTASPSTAQEASQ